LIYLDNNATTLIDPQVAALLGELYRCVSPTRAANMLPAVARDKSWRMRARNF
jgi:hypothetical protein